MYCLDMKVYKLDFKGQLGVPLTVYPWYLAGVLKGFLGNITHKYPLYRA